MSHQEIADDYGQVIAVIDDRTRVINCKDDIQWIVQHRSGGQWRNKAFCRRRATLLRLLPKVDVTTASLLETLAEIHP